ncbi:MAG TPA: hypothetical protein DFH96_08575 [Bacteroidetes bacterium]|jgi:hypothetical protein|nr:hypothetical protein [Bacteroidota bacterium]
MNIEEIFNDLESQSKNGILPTAKVEGNKEGRVKEYLPTAYQVIRLVKVNSMGSTKIERQIIDTISVVNGLFEAAKHKAVTKAKMMGHCMVIELCERAVIQIEEATIQSPTIMYKNGHKRKRGLA